MPSEFPSAQVPFECPSAWVPSKSPLSAQRNFRLGTDIDINIDIDTHIEIGINNAWEVSKYEVFSVPYLDIFYSETLNENYSSEMPLSKESLKF